MSADPVVIKVALAIWPDGEWAIRGSPREPIASSVAEAESWVRRRGGPLGRVLVVSVNVPAAPVTAQGEASDV
jgi:hypothetical protein